MSIKKKMMLAFSKGNRTIFDKNGDYMLIHYLIIILVCY